MKSLFVFTVSMVIMVSSVLGQSEKLSLDDCIQIALENNSQLRISKLQKESTERDVLGSYSSILPNIALSGAVYQTDRGQTNYIGNTRLPNPIPGEKSKSYSADLSLNQNIFDGGNWWYTIKQAEVNDDAQFFSHQTQINSTVGLVQERYYVLLKEQKLLEVYKLATERSKSQMERTEKMFELGSVAKVDVFRARVNLGTDSISYITQENTVKLAIQNLNLAMGKDPSQAISISREFELIRNTNPIDSLLEIAFEKNPNLKKSSSDEKSSGYTTKMAYGNLYPSLGGFVSYSRRVPQFDILYDDFSSEYTFQYGISLRLNLFNGFQDYVNIQKSKLNEKYYKENHVEIQRNLESTIRQLNDTFMAYLNIININTQNLEASNEEYRLAEERYRIGSGTSLEVREAQVNLTRAEQTLVAAQYNARIVQAQIEEQIGTIYQN